jgi:hypothetical protein
VVWPTEFELAPTVEKIDRTIERMLKLGARSATLEAHMVESAAKDDGVWPEGQDEAAIRDELETSLASARVPEQSESASKLSAAGYTAEGVASVVGFTDEQQQLLVGGPETGSVDQTNPDAAVVTSGAESGADRTGQPETEGGPQGPIPAGTRTPDTAPNAQRPQPPSAPSGSPPSQPSPDPSIEELRAEVAGLTAQVSALVAALAAKPEPSPAPIVLPIAMPQPAPAGKNVSVTEPNGRTWTVNVTPTTSNGTNPPNTSNPE